MIHISKIGENTLHDNSFLVDRPQGHSVYLLILVKTPARFFCEDRWIKTKKDVAVIFKPGQKHLYGSLIDENYIDDWLHIDSSSLILPEHFPYGTPIQLHNANNYYELFHLIHNEFFGVSPHKQTIIDALTNALLQKIMDENNTEQFPPIYYQLVNLREQIYSNPSKNWMIEDIADLLHISVGYLHLIYKQFFNTTCISDVINSRIEAACEFLTSTSKSVEEIGQLCGYNNTEHFIRQFKKVVGTTPGNYRKKGEDIRTIMS